MAPTRVLVLTTADRDSDPDRGPEQARVGVRAWLKDKVLDKDPDRVQVVGAEEDLARDSDQVTTADLRLDWDKTATIDQDRDSDQTIMAGLRRDSDQAGAEPRDRD